MADTELACAKTLKAGDGREIIDEGADVGAHLTQPESGFDDGHDTGFGHGFVIIGGASSHMGMRVDHHAQAAGGDGAEIIFVQLKARSVVHDFLQHAGRESTAATWT